MQDCTSISRHWELDQVLGHVEAGLGHWCPRVRSGVSHLGPAPGSCSHVSQDHEPLTTTHGLEAGPELPCRPGHLLPTPPSPASALVVLFTGSFFFSFLLAFNFFLFFFFKVKTYL